MRKPARLLSLVTVLTVLAVGAALAWHHAIEVARWRDLAAHLPTATQAVRPDYSHTHKWWFGVNDDKYQVGQVELGNRDVWQFAFASHHQLDGPDSYTVFRGKTGTVRFKGPAFCCEVDFGDRKQPADAEAFITLLRQSGVAQVHPPVGHGDVMEQDRPDPLGVFPDSPCGLGHRHAAAGQVQDHRLQEQDESAVRRAQGTSNRLTPGPGPPSTRSTWACT